MASGEMVALIGGVAVVGGALLCGMAQVLVAWRQGVDERNQEKISRYREVLRHLHSLPKLLDDPTDMVWSDVEARRREYLHQLDLLFADLALFAPQNIRDIANNDVQQVVNGGEAFDFERMSPAEISIQWRQKFIADVEPVIQRLANEMAKDAGLRKQRQTHLRRGISTRT